MSNHQEHFLDGHALDHCRAAALLFLAPTTHGGCMMSTHLRHIMEQCSEILQTLQRSCTARVLSKSCFQSLGSNCSTLAGKG